MKEWFVLMLILFHLSTTVLAEELFTYRQGRSDNSGEGSGTVLSKRVHMVPCRYISPQDLMRMARTCYPGLIIAADDGACAVVVKGTSKQIAAVQHLSDTLDRAPKQIAIETRVVEVSESGLEQLGVLWNVTQEGMKVGSTVADIDGVLKALEGCGQAKILATPRITALEHKEAFVRIGDRIPYALPAGGNLQDARWSVQYLDAGIILSIRPQLGISGNILIELHPQVINLKEWKPTPAGDFPILSSREAKTTVEVESGQSIAIAGLRNEELKENVTKVPFLGYIPLLGEVFTFRSKETVRTEIVFVMTPTLL